MDESPPFLHSSSDIKAQRYLRCKRYIYGANGPKIDESLSYPYSGHIDAITSLAWSPDGSRIASGSWDQTVHVWDTTSGKNILTYSGHSAKVDTLAWSPNGTYLASGSRDQTIQIWKADTGSHVSTHYARSKRVTCVAWSPTGAHLASVSYKGGEDAFDERADGAVQLWAAP